MTDEVPNESDSPTVSPWSCFNCRRRKARCDRRSPCVHCTKSGLECSFPLSGRMPTRQHGLNGVVNRPGEKKSELIDRVRYLESIVDRLSTQVRKETPSTCSCLGQDSSKAARPAQTDTLHLDSDFARLHIDDGGSLYIGNRFFSMLSKEVKDVRKKLEEDDYVGPRIHADEAPVKELSRIPFSFGQAQLCETVTQPLPSQVFYIWQVYVENVDPFIKILHVPTMDNIVRISKGKFDSLSPGMRALMFAICLAAITSMTDEEVQEGFNDSKPNMTNRFINGTEQALSQANFMSTSDICVAQAFLIYLEISGQYYGLRSIWTLAGSLTRTAVSMGLHRDGSNFDNVSHFDAEMRRRLWWHICFLDNRVGQCDVPEMAISEAMFDTKQPANVNDADISPDMDHEPVSRQGLTDMSFSIAGCHLWRHGRKIYAWMPSLLVRGEPADRIRNEALKSTREMREKLCKEVFQRPSGPKVPLQCFMEFIVSLVFNQMDTIIRHMDLFRNPFEVHAQGGRHESFLMSVETLKNVKLRKNQASSRQWSWIFVNYHQWHAAGIIFDQLRHRAWDSTSEAAWNLACDFAENAPPVMMEKNPLRGTVLALIVGARCQRRREFARMQIPQGPPRRLEAMLEPRDINGFQGFMSSATASASLKNISVDPTTLAVDAAEALGSEAVPVDFRVEDPITTWDSLTDDYSASSHSGSSNGAWRSRDVPMSGDPSVFLLNYATRAHVPAGNDGNDGHPQSVSIDTVYFNNGTSDTHTNCPVVEAAMKSQGLDGGLFNAVDLDDDFFRI